MPNKRTRKRRAAKKLANNVANVLRRRIENLKEEEANLAEQNYREFSGYYNANQTPENNNIFRENENAIGLIAATATPLMFSPPVRSKPAGRRQYTAHGENRRILNEMRAAALRQIHPELNFRPKSKSKTRRSKRY
jgi:hypothetical protein